MDAASSVMTAGGRIQSNLSRRDGSKAKRRRANMRGWSTNWENQSSVRSGSPVKDATASNGEWRWMSMFGGASKREGRADSFSARSSRRRARRCRSAEEAEKSNGSCSEAMIVAASAPSGKVYSLSGVQRCKHTYSHP